VSQQQTQFLPPYLLQGSLRTDVTMDAFLTTPLEDRFPGEPIHIVATLTDTGPIPNATVRAIVEQPGGNTFPASGLTLFDDGLHDDGEANDGLYGNTYYYTGNPGSYVVTVEANGTSDLAGGPFERQKLLAFHLNSEGDRDGDGLPDEWEEREGTDPDRPDADEDPDNDGSDNAEERDRGTDPRDPDTDDGGEADGSDTDPFDPSDDDIEPTWASVYPGDEVVYVKFAVRDEYTLAAPFRSLDPTGPFSDTALLDPSTGIYTDTNVVNDQTYCYIILAVDAGNNRTAPHDPVCATPRADPFPPYGFILINDGASLAFSPEVTLTLWASDTVDEEGEVFTDPPLPSADSASGVVEMRINNTSDMEGVAWESYTTTKDWTLDEQNGLAGVFVQYRDAAGNESDVFPATILVDPDAEPEPPELTGTSPADGTTDVALGQTVVITFSEEMDTDSVSYTFEPEVSGISETWSISNTVLTLSHDPFTAATAYTVTVTAGSDTEGESLVAAPVSWSFTTADDGGGEPPALTGTSPADGTTDVALDQTVVITFSEEMDTASVSYTFEPEVSGISETWSISNTVLTLSHDPFTAATAYTVTVTAGSDTEGQSLVAAPVSWSFTTADDGGGEPPALTGTSPADGATDVALDQAVMITFSEEMDTASVSYTFEPEVSGISETWSTSNTVLTLSHDPFTAATAYTVTVTAGSDTEGESLVAAPVSWSFTTADDGGGEPPGANQRLYLPFIAK
jgi:methionine-rich copper-binding protein CopC